jgi:hypothetical protein
VSYDRKLDQICPHLVVEESLFVGSDRVTVRPQRPISAFNSVRVRLNGETEVPSSGVDLPALAKGSKPGPFTISSTTNTLIVQVGNEAPQTVQIPVGKNLTPQQVSRLLNDRLRGAFTTVSKKHVCLNSVVKGPEGTLFIHTGSSLAPVLGFPVNRQWKGRSLVPGWSLVQDPNTLSDRPSRLIVFDRPLLGSLDYVEIDYATIQQECRRCGGIGIEYDWRDGRTGGGVAVIDESLLIQEVLKIVYTVRGSNPFHAWYGTSIIDSIGKKHRSILKNMIVAEINEAIRRWQDIKKQQESGRTGQEVTDKEFPFRLVGVNVQEDSSDPTVLAVTVTIQNRSGRSFSVERTLKVPEPEDLLGSTAQQGVFRNSLSGFTLLE